MKMYFTSNNNNIKYKSPPLSYIPYTMSMVVFLVVLRLRSNLCVLSHQHHIDQDALLLPQSIKSQNIEVVFWYDGIGEGMEWATLVGM